MPPVAIREISGPAGGLESILEEPDLAPGAPLSAAVVFAHPHPLQGGTMHTKIVYRCAKALVSLGCAVLRFNFRGVGASEGMFDNGVGEKDDFRAGLDFMVTRYPDADLWAAGFSFGSYISLVAGNADDRVTALIGIAPALLMYDFSPIVTSTRPKFFVQGANDEICPLPHLQAFFEELAEPKKLAIVPGANHLFTGKVDEGAEALREIVADYLASAPASKP
jgi:alpha/beta superfamily hydrolase